MKISKATVALFLLPCVLLFALVYLAPIALVFGSSLTSWKAGSAMKFVGLRNYVNGFSDPSILRALKNTGIWVLLQSTVHVAIGTVSAMILAKKRPGWKFFRTAFMIPNVISMAALSVILLNVFRPEIGLINSFFSLFTGQPSSINFYFSIHTAFPTVTVGWLLYAGLICILMLAAIQSVPLEILEAARIDGASGLQIDLRIILPLVRGSLGTAVIIAATSMLKEFEMIFLTTNGGPGTMTLNLPLYLYKTALTENNYGYANMMGVLLIGAGVLVVFIINRVFRMDEADY